MRAALDEARALCARSARMALDGNSLGAAAGAIAALGKILDILETEWTARTFERLGAESEAQS